MSGYNFILRELAAPIFRAHRRDPGKAAAVMGAIQAVLIVDMDLSISS